MATQRDYYEILGVERTADGDTIKRSYRKLAMKYHPDRNPGDKEAETKFKEAAEAFEVLTDDTKRKRYDQFGHDGLRGTSGHDFSNMDPNDIFSMFGFGDILEQMFGGGRGRRGGGARATRGYDLETEVEITIEEVAHGTKREVEFTRQDNCPTCKGNGAKPGTEPITCVVCGGQGQVAQSGLGGAFRMVTTCPECKGAGKKYAEKCTDCHGSGRKPKRRVLNVEIPPGVHDGQAVRVAGEGEPGTRGGPHGDLHVVIRVAEHNLFVRENDHLILRTPISFAQAALGATVAVATLDGKEEITIKSGTQHGDMQRLDGKGLPNLRSKQRGDLIVVLMIEIPKKLTGEQKELLEQYAATENLDVMPHSKGFWDRIKEYITD